MATHLSPKQVARAVGVSEASLKRWCDKGLITTVRTPGGHRRMPLDKVVEFIRSTGHTLVRPEILGLPSTTGKGDTVIDRAREQVREALEAGDDECVRRIGFDLYLAGHSALVICDRIVAPVFQILGQRWQHGDIEVYQERRACEIVLRFLHELRAMQSTPAADAPLALTSTAEGDTYSLPITMIDVVLREAGWRSSSLGPGNPFKSLLAATRTLQPRLFCLSVCVQPANEELYLREYSEFYSGAQALGVAVAVGGRILTGEFRAKMQYANYSENLDKLVSFAQALKR